MELNVYEIEKYQKLPDVHGAIYDAIEEFKPYNYIKLENYIKAFLDYSDPEKIEKSPPISACMLVAPWGMGKTSTYDLLIKDLLKEEGYNGISIKIRAQEISNYYETFIDKKEFKMIPGNSDRLLFLLSKLLLKNSEFTILFPDLKKECQGIEFIGKLLNSIKEKYDFFLIFIDELEEVVRNTNDIIPFILKAIKDLLNGSSNIITNQSNPELIHFLSFILACTDAAIYEISRLEQLEYQYGGIKRRIHEERILDISLEESIEYLMKLNKFCYNGDFIKSFINPGASFNVIARMAMKNPGYMKSYFTQFMIRSGSQLSNDLMYQIDGKFILENSKNFSLEYMETQRRAINNEVYNNWIPKFKNNEIIKNFIYLFLGEIKAFTLEELDERFDENISKSDIFTSISIFNQYISSIHSNVKEAIIPVKILKNEITRADIQNILKECGFPIEEKDNFQYSIKFRAEGYILFEEFLESISYYKIDNNGNLKAIFFFSEDNEILKQLFPNLSNATIKILTTQFIKHFKDNKEYYILNPSIFNIIFPLPIPQEYNLLHDKNETVRLWTEISRRKKTEIYKKEICRIVPNFLISYGLISKHKTKDRESKTFYVDDFEFFEDVLDKNKFLILKNFKISELSNNPINIMFWREIENYNIGIISEITSRVNTFQRNELNNIHLLILLSQNKIPENLIDDLAKNMEYSIVKEFQLSQFDITKYVFLHEVKEKYQGSYDQEKYDLSITQLNTPFEDIIKNSKEDIENKGLGIKLNNYMSNLSDIPQLMKYILYDFTSDFGNYSKVKLIKPFDNVNPIGLSPRYSSSIDDWSEEKLRINISNYLLVNNFLKLKENSLKISLPKIEKNILQLVKTFVNDGIKIPVNNLRFFFFDKSDNPSLLTDVFLTDLENRGLIEIKKDKNKTQVISILEISKSELSKKLNAISTKINTLKIKDLNFYHTFTIKQRDFSLIYLEDFLNTLEMLLNLKPNTNFDKNFPYTRNILFRRISKVFNRIIDHIFFPLNQKLTNFENELVKKRNEKYKIDFIVRKLKEFGLTDVKIENFNDIKILEQNFSSILKKIEEPINKEELEKKGTQYYKTHKDQVRVAGELFSYLRLQENKLNKDFVSPFLNLLYNDMEIEKKQFLNDPIFEKIDKINELIKKVDNNYKIIQGQFTKVSLDDSSKLATNIFEKVKTLSNFKFVKTSEIVENFNQIENFLTNLNEDINKISVPISQILKRKGRGVNKSLLENIKSSENYIETQKNRIKSEVKYLTQKNIIEEKRDTEKITEPIKDLDYSNFIDEINACENLEDLEVLSTEINNKLQIQKDMLDHVILNIYTYVYDFFKEIKAKKIDTLKKLFRSLKMNKYEKNCENYLNSLKNLLVKSEEIFSLKDECGRLIILKTKIEEGYEQVLKDRLDEETQKVYLEVSERFGAKKWFDESQLNEVGKKFNLSNEKISKILTDLLEKNLIEKYYHFK